MKKKKTGFDIKKFAEEKKNNTPELKKIIVNAGVFLVCAAIVIAAAISISRSLKTNRSNSAELASYQEESSSLADEIANYDYNLENKSKDELVEDAARQDGYIYPNETAYYNCTPGA